MENNIFMINDCKDKIKLFDYINIKNALINKDKKIIKTIFE